MTSRDSDPPDTSAKSPTDPAAPTPTARTVLSGAQALQEQIARHLSEIEAERAKARRKIDGDS